jgi:multiple sugar transport system permease protein
MAKPVTDLQVSGSTSARRKGRPDGAGSATGALKGMPTVAVSLFLVVMTGYFLAPIWWLVVASTKSQGDVYTGFILWFSHVQITDNLGALFARDGGLYARWLLNSLVYCGAAAIIGTVISALAGYGLAKFRFPGRDIAFGVILGGVLVPATALALPLFLMFSSLGITNSALAVVLPSVVNPFGVYLARIYAIAAIPDEIIEAGRIDGAGETRIFFEVAWRMMTPALGTIFLFQFVAVWNNYLLPLVMLQDRNLFPVTLGLAQWNTQFIQDPSLQLLTIVGSFVSIIPLTIVFLALQRYWRSGLAIGSVTG